MSRLFPKAIFNQELLTYLSIASIGFLVNIFSRILYYDYWKIPFGYSVVLAYLTGMVVGFTLTKLFAFDARKSNNTYREIMKFTIVSLCALTVTYIMSITFRWVQSYFFNAYPSYHQYVVEKISQFHIRFINRELFAHLAGTGFGFFVNFFGHKFFTFKSTGVYNKIKPRQYS